MSALDVSYRSDRPEVIDAWHSFQAAHERFVEAVDTLTAELWPDPVEDHKPSPLIAHGTSWEPGMRRLCGWSWPYGVAVPEGWKFERINSMVSPKVSTKKGKAVKAHMDEVAPDVRALQLPGMPKNDISHLPSLYSPSVEFIAGHIYVCWSIEPPGVDGSLWDKIKLSTYYSVKEAHLAEETA